MARLTWVELSDSEGGEMASFTIFRAVAASLCLISPTKMRTL